MEWRAVQIQFCGVIFDCFIMVRSYSSIRSPLSLKSQGLGTKGGRRSTKVSMSIDRKEGGEGGGGGEGGRDNE